MSIDAARATPRGGELRATMRDWRRGRSELKIWQVFEDAYVALLSTVIIGSMAGNVVWGLRTMTDAACRGACADARSLLPMSAALLAVLLALALARLLGPVFVSPAASAWLLSTPVDRRDLLRPSLWRTVAGAGFAAAALAAAPVLLAGRGPAESALHLAAVAGAAAAGTAYAARCQIRERRGAVRVTWLVTATLWILMLAAASGRAELPPPGVSDTSWLVGLAAGAALTIGLAVVLAFGSDRDLALVRRRTLAETESTWPSLSGALASFDLGLMYDVLLARRWSTAASVRSRRGGPKGAMALVHRDLLRVARAPQPWILLLILLVVPYALAAAEAGRGVMLGTSLTALLVGPSLCAGLRVVTRTDGLVVMLPFRRRTVLTAHLLVPGLGLMAYALLAAPALLTIAEPPEAVGLSVATGLVGVAATARWVCARPPDFARPLVSTPAGGVPTGLVANLARGIDVWLVAGLPLLIEGWGVGLSVGVSVLTLWWVTRPDARRESGQPQPR